MPKQLFTLLADVEHIPRVDYNDIDYIIIYMLCQIMLANRYFIMSECMSMIVKYVYPRLETSLPARPYHGLFS